jgi:hypothetical protein
VKCDASLDENDCATTRPYALDFADEWKLAFVSISDLGIGSIIQICSPIMENREANGQHEHRVRSVSMHNFIMWLSRLIIW